MTEISEKLLPCPFCGGEAELIVPTETDRWAQVNCKGCGSRATEYPSDPLRAIGAWNARFAHPHLPTTPEGGWKAIAVGKRVRQFNVHGGTRDGEVIEVTEDTFTVKWDGQTVACTYGPSFLDEAAACPIRALSASSAAGVESDERCSINMRVNRRTLALIDEAAAAQGKTRSEFLRDCAQQDAEAVLASSRPIGGEREKIARSIYKALVFGTDELVERHFAIVAAEPGGISDPQMGVGRAYRLADAVLALTAPSADNPK